MQARASEWVLTSWVGLLRSERLNRSQAEGQRQKEACSINKSLSSLGDVFAALAAKSPHIPYRNSKLTHLLQVRPLFRCSVLSFPYNCAAGQLCPCAPVTHWTYVRQALYSLVCIDATPWGRCNQCLCIQWMPMTAG